jgi:hypothetical protein
MIFCGFKLSQEMFDTTQITKNWGIFQGQLWRNGLEAKWLIYVILKGIGKVSNRFYKFSFLMVISWGRYEWKKRWRQNVPLENCRWSHLTSNPNIFMLIPFIYRYLSHSQIMVPIAARLCEKMNFMIMTK